DGRPVMKQGEATMATFLGRFVWHDLVTPDVDAAVAFYKAVIGWETQAFDGGDKPYTMWVTPGGKPVGGVVALSDEMKAAGAQPHWFAHIATPDLAATLEKARGLGARVIWEPEAVPTVGQFAIMLDPEGVDFAAFQP